MSVIAFALVAFVTIVVAFTLFRIPRLWAFLFFFLVVFPKLPLAVVPGNTTPIRLDDLMVACVLGGWVLVRGLTVREVRVPSPISPFLILFLAAALVSTLVGIASQSTGTAAGVFHFLRMVEYALLYYFFFHSVTRDDLPDFVRVVAVTFALIFVIGAAQPLLGVSAGAAHPSFSASYDLGGYVMLAVVVFYALWAERGTRAVLLTGALVLSLYTLLIADSRSSFMGVAAALAFDVLLRVRLRTAVVLILLGAVAPVLLQSAKMEQLLALLLSFDMDRILAAFYEDPSIGYRLMNWQLALDHWQAAPFLGDGLGAYLQYVRIYNLPGSPDGWYVRTLAETGLVGLLTFVLLLGSSIWTCMQAHARETDPLRRALLYGGTLAVVATSVHAVFIDTFVSFKIMAAFWAIVAVATRVAAERPVDASERAIRLAPLPEPGR